MGGLRDRITGWLFKNMQTVIRGSSSVMGGKLIMMGDNPNEYINKGLLYNPDVAAVVGYIKKVAVQVPWILKQGDTVIENHSILDTWEKPNPITRGSNFLATWIEHYLVTGNGYIKGMAPENGINAGKFKELYNLHYDMAIEKGDRIEPILSYKNVKDQTVYPSNQVLHWKTTDPSGDGYYGVSPLKAARAVLQQSNDAYEANAKSLQNLGAAGILMRKDATQAGPEQAKKLKEMYKKEMSGSDKFGKIVITGGDYEFLNFSRSPVDLALLDSQIKSRQAICNVYGFPSELLNDKEASTYNNFLEKRKQLYTNIIIPLLDEIQELLNGWFVKPWGDNLTFEPDWSKVPELQKDLGQLVTWLKDAWWLKGTDKQRIMGMEEDAEMDQYFVPMGLIPEQGEINIDEAKKEYGLEGN